MSSNQKPQSDSIMIALGNIVRGYAQNHTLDLTTLTQTIHAVYSTLNNLHSKAYHSAGLNPNIPADKSLQEESIQDDYLICLEDGKKLKMLKRHLRTTYQMTPEQYKERWGLPANYPMVAPKYAQTRSALAKSNGLGRGRKAAAAAASSSNSTFPSTNLMTGSGS